MSSDLKDARWGLAMALAADTGLDWSEGFRRDEGYYDPKWDDVHHGEMIW